MAYKALRQMNVGGVTVEPGELIAEAMDWPNVSAWLRNGFIEEVPDPEATPKAATPRRAPAKKAPAKTAARKPAAKKTPTKKTKE